MPQIDASSGLSIGLLFTAIAGIIGIATFFIGRKTSAHNEGEWRGELKATLHHMQGDISDIKDMQSKQSQKMSDNLDAIEKKFDESIRRVHLRLNEHLAREHGKTGSEIV